MQFTVLSWNIWFDNQINGTTRSDKLLAELERVIEKYQPDCICMNEVARSVDTLEPFVHTFLVSKGFVHHYFAPAGPLNNEWVVGASICSRLPFKKIESFVLGRDVPSERRGFVDATRQGITAEIKLSNDKTINIIVAHPEHLRSWTIRDHYKHTAKLTEMLKQKEYQQDTIICGDFNEPGFMPKSFARANKAALHYRTGKSFHTTWRFMAWSLMPIRANLDKLFWTRAGNLVIKRFRVIHTNVSDHRPLLATFAFQSRERRRGHLKKKLRA